MAQRRKLPSSLETTVLTRSARRCCLCFGLHNDAKIKEGQIAHLDDDSSITNLKTSPGLCLFHHAQLHMRGGMTKGVKPDEVKQYRERLCRAVDAGGLADMEPSRPATLNRTTFNVVAGDRSTVTNVAGSLN